MFNLPFLRQNGGDSEKYIFMLFLSGEKAYGFAFEEGNPENGSSLYQEHIDPFLKNASDKIEKILANCERDLGENVYLKRTVLVLNSLYTTETGSIREDFLKQIKKLLKSADLENLGYLNFYEVVAYNITNPHTYYYLEESVYDFSLFLIEKGQLKKTLKIAKTAQIEANFKEIEKQMEEEYEITAYFYKSPSEKALEIKRLIVEEELVNFFIKVYFKDKEVPKNETKEETKEEVKTENQETSLLPLAPGFSDAQEELAFKEDLPEKDYVSPPVFPQKKFSLPKFNFNFKLPKLSNSGYLLGGILAFLLLLLSYFFFFHKAKVILSTKKESYSANINFKVNENSGFVKEFISKVAVKAQLTTTGEKITGEKAKGEVTIYNGLFEKKDLSEGAQFTAKNGAVFVINSAVSVPSSTTSANLDEGVVTKAFGKKTVEVTALEIGAEGNIDSGSKLTYSDVSENDFYALSNNNFGGGVKRTVSIFSNKDAQTLEDKALSLSKNKLKSDFQKEVSEDDILFSETISARGVKKNFSEEVGAEINRVTLEFNGTVQAFYAPYDSLIQKVQSDKLKDKEFVEGTFALNKIQLIKEDKNTFTYSAIVKGKVQNYVDQKGLLERLKGKFVVSANKSLADEHNIIRYTVSTYPLPLPILPINTRAISLEFER